MKLLAIFQLFFIGGNLKALDFECPSNFVPLHNSCYNFSEDRATFNEALDACKAMNASLLTIETDDENAAVKQYLHENHRSIFYWTSGSDMKQEGEFVWMSSLKMFNFTDWCPGQPDNHGQIENCVHLYVGNTCWNDIACDNDVYGSTPILYICEYAPPINNHINLKALDFECPSNFVPLHNSCYNFSEDRATFNGALDACKAMDASLLTIETDDENAAVKQYLHENRRSKFYWTSGSDMKQEGEFVWMSSLKMFNFTDWCPGQPDNYGQIENCVHLYSGNTYNCWNDILCDNDVYGSNPILYICEYAPPINNHINIVIAA